MLTIRPKKKKKKKKKKELKKLWKISEKKYKHVETKFYTRWYTCRNVNVINNVFKKRYIYIYIYQNEFSYFFDIWVDQQRKITLNSNTDQKYIFIYDILLTFFHIYIHPYIYMCSFFFKHVEICTSNLNLA